METEKKILPGFLPAVLVVTGALLGSFAAIFIFGPLDISAFSAPINYYLALAIVLIGTIAAFFKGSIIFRFLGGGHLAVVLVVIFLIYGLIMGIVPQGLELENDTLKGIVSRLGFFSLTSSWPFVTFYLFVLLSLAVAISLKLGKRGSFSFILIHLGIFLVLMAAGLGAPDRQRHIMRVGEGQVEWRSMGKAGELISLPIAIRLDDFSMEEYPGQLALIDNHGVMLPENKPELMPLNGTINEYGTLLGYKITVLEFLLRAVPVGKGEFARAIMAASTQAVRVEVEEIGKGRANLSEGWISYGNPMIAPQVLELSQSKYLVMTRPDPKSFASRIKVFTQEGQEQEGEVLVNKPLKIGQWLIYQHGYENSLGNLSPWSSFLLVKDPFLYLAYLGFILWALGAFTLVLKGNRK
ncbi:MAG: cytochrome c biogenesis protein ResB [Deltaproteobacteria bacterium]|nr:cytochrome c biogenesis protein ResB [Deltaproteobacteria bacterium]